jgi:hypothetical protein
VRPGPGFQAQRTSEVSIWAIKSCSDLFPFFAGSFKVRQSSPVLRPFQAIGVFGGGSCQSAAPGGPWRTVAFSD